MIYRFFYLIAMMSLLWGLNATNVAIASPLSSNIYEQRAIHSSDGIGKYYMGREIAKFMGHTGAGWLERPSREADEQPSKIIQALNLKPDDVVADIGAGTGYMTWQIAPLLTQGKVVAVDIQPEMLEILKYLQQEKNITNVESVLATPSNPHLSPASIDLALMVDAYHEFEYPQEVMQGIVQALKPGGRAVLVEYRGENPFIMIKRLHKMTQKQVRQEMANVGLIWRETQNLLPQQHLMVFENQLKNNPSLSEDRRSATLGGYAIASFANYAVKIDHRIK